MYSLKFGLGGMANNMADKTYGIIGHPVKHSLSPAMQNAAFKALGIDAQYKPFDLEPENLERFLDNLDDESIRGLNVTIPHKIKAKEYIEKRGSLDTNAKRLGAVNTINILAGEMKGYNTDGPGFYRSLVEDLKFEPEGKNVFVLGAGGASHALIMYLGNGPKKIYVFDVDAKKAADLKDHYKGYYDAARLEVIGAFVDIKSALSKSHLLVNATPIGMEESDPSPIDKDMLHAGLYVYDLVYNRSATALVKDAASLKLHATTGLGMLLYQGAIAFEIWTECKAPIDIMKKALKAALSQSSAAALPSDGGDSR